MITLPISDIIRDSFKLAWKHKYLWLFGLFAGGGISFNLPIDSSESSLGQYEQAYEWLLAALALVILVGLAVFVIVMILHVISKCALIYNVYQIETNGVHGLGDGWDFGLKRFWTMLGLTFLQFIVLFAFILVLIVIAVLMFFIATVLGFLSLLVVLPSLLAGVVLVVMIWTYAERFVILERRGVIEAIGDGWSLLRSQWRPSLTMGLVKFAITAAAGIGVMGVAAVLILPAVPMWFASPALAVVYGIVVLLPLMILTGAYFGTFDYAAWTKTFLLLRAPAYAAAAQPGSTPAVPPDTAGDSDEARPTPPLFE